MKARRIKEALRRKLAALLIVVLVLGMMPGNGAVALAEGDSGSGEDSKVEKIDLSGADVTISGRYIYTGEKIEPTTSAISVTLSGTAIDLTECKIEFSNNVDAGTASAIITASENTAQYTGSVSGTFIIEKATPDIGAVTASPIENSFDISKIMLDYANKTVHGELKLRDDTKLNYGENPCIWEFTPEDNKNYHITSGSVTITVKDTILPTAKYRIGTEERAFKELNDKTTTSDSIFCEVGAFVEIMAIDDTENVSGSGVKEVSYSIEDSEKEITDITINAITWEKYNAPVPLNATGSCIIYVKVVDNASNSAILKSEKILVYGESSIKPETLSYHYKANTDASVTLTLNGNTFQELTDEDGTIIDKSYYELENTNTLTLKASYLDTLDKGEYCYKVRMNRLGTEADKAPLEYTFQVKVEARELTVKEATAEGRAYNGEKDIRITEVKLEGIADSDKGKIAVDSSKVKGTLSSANAGSYETVELTGLVLTGPAAGNYVLKETTTTVPTNVKIKKAEPDTRNDQNKSYLYSKETPDSIDLAKLLPKNYGIVTYGAITTSGIVTYKIEPSLNNGMLSYTISSGGTIGATGKIEIAVKTQNYEDFTIVVNLKLTEKIPVSLVENEDSILANDTITYGEPLSNLKFKETVEFVDDENKKVEGTIEWKTPNELPETNIQSATWIFTPKDTTTYEIAEVTVNITVNKAIPYIAALPVASDITYGDSLSKSNFSGGIVKHGNGKGQDGDSAISSQAIRGHFTWKDASINPSVSDSGKTKYIVVFSPDDSDAMNYEPRECEVTLIVNKAAFPPNRPSDTVNATENDNTVGDISLPDKWEWEEEYKNIPLTEGAKVIAKAVYKGDDTGNYENETITITLTKGSNNTPSYPTGGGHQHFFSSKITKEPTCTERGIRTYSCPCGASYTDEIEEFGEHQYTSQVTKQPTATAQGVRTYTCNYCKKSYTEAIAKLGSEEEKPEEDKDPDPSETTVSKATMEKNGVTMNTKLTVGQIGSKIYVEWGRVSGADGYDVYVQYCGKDFTSKPSESIKGTERAKVAVSKIDGKKLDLKKNYKIYVAAYKLVGGKKVSLGKSITAHGIGRENKSYTNASEIVLKKDSYNLKSGETATISASTVRDDKNKKLLSNAHAKEFRYASSNKNIATVSSAGKIKAVGKGSCTVYVYSRNGYAEAVKVTVK